MRTHPLNGFSIALAAASLFAVVPLQAGSSGDNVRCHGVNSCKGRGSCATANNQCAGQNTCKGKGVLEMSKAACDAAGGTVES